MAIELSAAVHRQALELLERGELIMCVKLIREATGCGLAEARAWVDDLAGSKDPQEASIGQRLEQERREAESASARAALEHDAALRAARAMPLAPELLELCWQRHCGQSAIALEAALSCWPAEQVRAAGLLAAELEHRARVLCDVARGGWSEEEDVEFNLRQLCPGFSESAYREALAQAWQDTR
ncbi:hypothetical protein IT575_11735 [bacterium]|nr:hypothetical protein [bacterium]